MVVKHFCAKYCSTKMHGKLGKHPWAEMPRSRLVFLSSSFVAIDVGRFFPPK
jgi:hypothetical protein